MFFVTPWFYYVSIGLQALCVIHCMRRGNQQKWIWIIVFLPIVGCIAYIFTEMVNGRRLSSNVQDGVGAVFNSVGRIKKLEDNLRFTDTFNNRIALADAYLNAGQTDKAIALYEQSMTGAFTENELLLSRLIAAYYKVKRYDDILPLARKLYKTVPFARSRSHILYALALEQTGQYGQAEKEFETMKARFSNFEARYQYGMFLRRAGRDEEARKTFFTMLDEAPHLSRRERRYSRQWFAYAKDELAKMEKTTA
ncbi:MAG: PLDc N-terminal domain-containing protein [Bacteroidetes bacterium]|nr:PLDc N-terminal domain-containing protein [Bacteroidota bacterium]